MKTLFDTVAEFISGDWGADIESVEAPVLAHCIRAADVEPIEAHNYTTIPTRYLSRKSFTQRQLKFGDIVIEKSGGSPTQSTGRVVYISHALLSAKTNLVCSNFCTAIRLKREWHPYFVFQYWRQVYNAKVFFNYEGKTSGLKNLQLETAMKSIPIPKIDPPTQLRIAGLITSMIVLLGSVPISRFNRQTHRPSISVNRLSISAIVGIVSRTTQGRIGNRLFPNSQSLPQKTPSVIRSSPYQLQD